MQYKIVINTGRGLAELGPDIYSVVEISSNKIYSRHSTLSKAQSQIKILQRFDGSKTVHLLYEQS